MNVENIIGAVKKLIPFKESEFEQVVKYFSVQQVKKNEVWEKEGVISQQMGFVNKGILRQYYLKEGNEFTDHFFTENDFLGNYISYLSKEPSRSLTVALEDCELLVMPFSQVEILSESIPNFQRFSKLVGDQKLVELNNRSASLLMDTPEERYYKFLDQHPELFNRIPQYLIAQYLGIRPESLSRIRKRHLS